MTSAPGAGRTEERGKGGVLLVSPVGNPNVRADLAALERAAMLSLYCTTIALHRDSRALRLLPRGLRSRLDRRVMSEVARSRIRNFPARDAVRQVARGLGLVSITEGERRWASSDGVFRGLDADVARLIRGKRVSPAAVYAYEDGALACFEAAAERGIRRFYELPIGYWRTGLRILAEEAERQPEWAATIPILSDSKEKQQRKDAEARAADHIIVPSDFVRDSLREHPGFTASIDVIPYGAPTPRRSAPAPRKPGTPLRVLYVGYLTQRKGLSYLFEAMHAVSGAATLTLVGAKPAANCPALDSELARHRWLGSLPHRRVLEVMAEQDVLVFPSLFEGFALVILEAMAQGLPVLTTFNSGGSMAIDDGENGFIVPIRDTDAIAERVVLLARDRERQQAMSRAALVRAERMSWAVRGERLTRTIAERLASRAA